MVKKKILVVDDEPDYLELIKARLEANYYEVITASNGKEALEKIKNDKPDAVFLDILMPQFDGLETLEEIRKQNKNLPVFIITAFSNEERIKLAKKLGVSDFIVKTSDLGEVIGNIASIF
ncbi:MAG: response regulator [Candidatus Omnitrophota bacterium]